MSARRICTHNAELRLTDTHIRSRQDRKFEGLAASNNLAA
jgi:hypothetical protein